MKGPPDAALQNREAENIAAEEDLNTAEDDLTVHANAHENVSDAEEDADPVQPEDLLENYGWMANEEEYDQQILEEFEQEEYLEQCFEDMWEEEEQWVVFPIPPPDMNDQVDGDFSSQNNQERLTVAEPTDAVPQPQNDSNHDAEDYIPRSDSQS